MIVSNAEKTQWIGKIVSLNGKPAKIAGRKEFYPRVHEIDGPLSVTFSWQAVKRIITNNNGHFTAVV